MVFPSFATTWPKPSRAKWNSSTGPKHFGGRPENLDFRRTDCPTIASRGPPHPKDGTSFGLFRTRNTVKCKCVIPFENKCTPENSHGSGVHHLFVVEKGLPRGHSSLPCEFHGVYGSGQRRPLEVCFPLATRGFAGLQVGSRKT